MSLWPSFLPLHWVLPAARDKCACGGSVAPDIVNSRQTARRASVLFDRRSVALRQIHSSKSLASVFRNHMIVLVHPRPDTRGRFGRSPRNVSAGCDGRGGTLDDAGRRGRKACGPDPPDAGIKRLRTFRKARPSLTSPV